MTDESTQETEPTATMVFRDGPLDGLQLIWPEDAGHFPVVVQFGLQPSGDSAGIIEIDAVPLHRYEAFYGYSHGPISDKDGLELHDVQEYLYENCEAAATDEAEVTK